MSGTTYVPIAAPSSSRGLALFEEIVAEIEAHEFATWDQRYWLTKDGDDDPIYVEDLDPEVRQTLVPAVGCGTVACLYGHAAFKAGGQMIPMGTTDGANPNEDVTISTGTVQVGDAERGIEGYARELLGLSLELSNWISDADRIWPEIRGFLLAWREDAAVDPDCVAHRWDYIDGAPDHDEADVELAAS